MNRERLQTQRDKCLLPSSSSPPTFFLPSLPVSFLSRPSISSSLHSFSCSKGNILLSPLRLQWPRTRFIHVNALLSIPFNRSPVPEENLSKSVLKSRPLMQRTGRPLHFMQSASEQSNTPDCKKTTVRRKEENGIGVGRQPARIAQPK